jgi:hypothetical protein
MHASKYNIELDLELQPQPPTLNVAEDSNLEAPLSSAFVKNKKSRDVAHFISPDFLPVKKDICIKPYHHQAEQRAI